MESSYKKSNEIAEACRNEGNRCYVQKKFFDAILKYNEALCYAENDSENAGLAYANRSAVYFEMKIYDKSLKNIALARANNNPKKNFEILKKREVKCYEMIKNNQPTATNDLNLFKLSYKSYKNLPSIANCLELKCDDKYGRHIITNRNLSVGDIVAIEDCVSKVIKADDRYSTCYANNIYQRCSNCLKENFLDLIPCSQCNKTMFCSEKCKEQSFLRHHEYECPIIDDLLKSGIKHIVLRMLFEAISLFNHKIDELQEFLEHNKDKNMTIFEIASNDNEKEKNSLLATLSLSLSVSCRENSLDEYEEIFQKTSILKAIWNEHKTFISSLLQRLITIGNRDVHGIGSWSLREKGMENHDEAKNPSQYQQLIGNACYLFSSFLNHSCAPNIKRLNCESKNVIFVSREIKAGQQLFDSYRQNFNLQSKSERQENLLKDYGFNCDCEACVENWPINKDLKIVDENLLEYAWECHDELPFISNPYIAAQKLKEYNTAFANHQENFPSAELIILQECISNCLLSITKPSFQFS